MAASQADTMTHTQDKYIYFLRLMLEYGVFIMFIYFVLKFVMSFKAIFEYVNP